MTSKQLDYYVVQNGAMFVAKTLQTSLEVYAWSLSDVERQIRVQHQNRFEPHSAPLSDYITYYLIKLGLFEGRTFKIHLHFPN